MKNAVYKVLIVEDDVSSRLYLEILLEKEGFQFKSACNGREGLEVFKTFEPHIVLSDIRMPEMTGLELLAEVRKIAPQTIFIVLTAFKSEDYIIKSLQLGANNYLKKPVNRSEIIDLFEKYSKQLDANSILHSKDFKITSHNLSLVLDNDIHSVSYISSYLVSLIKNCFAEDDMLGIQLGIGEILVNAIEHGNLNINFSEKSLAIKNNALEQLHLERKTHPEFADKKVFVQFTMNEQFCEWVIRDQGFGFVPESIPNPILDDGFEVAHGRGIFITKFYFDEMIYEENGTKVTLRKRL